MARLPYRKLEILCSAAALFDKRAVHTWTSQYKLVRVIVNHEGGDAQADACAVNATERVIKRAYTPVRLPKLWADVLRCSRLPKSDPKHVSLTDQGAWRLGVQLLAGNPAFALVNAELDAARRADSPDARLAHLTSAANTLAKVVSAASAGTGVSDAALRENASAAWAQLFDAVVADDQLGEDAWALAERAVQAGHACLHPVRPTKPVGPDAAAAAVPDDDELDLRWGESGQWAVAAGVLAVLRGTRVSRVVAATRRWLGDHRGGAETAVAPGELLTQIAWRLLLAGHIEPASRVSFAAWRAAGPHAPTELLELSVHLAGVLYSHGELGAAGRALPPRMRAVLAGPPPGGGPDDTWADEISSWFYSSLLRALRDPGGAVERFRMEWLNALRQESMSTGYPSKWLLAGAFVQLLVQSGDPASAASAAAVSVHALDEPVDAAELRIRAHLSAMSGRLRRVPSPGAAGRVERLVGDLAQVVVLQPAALDHLACRTLEGLLLVGKFELGYHKQIGDALAAVIPPAAEP